MAVNVGFFRTSWGNLIQLYNTAVNPSDYDSYCISAPTDPRLPGGGGYQVCGLYDIKPSKFGIVQNQVTQASQFGNSKEVYTGIDSVFTARFGHGGNVSGGMSTGRLATECVSPNYTTASLYCGCQRTTSTATSVGTCRWLKSVFCAH